MKNEGYSFHGRKLDPKKIVSFKEFLMSNVYEQEALINREQPGEGKDADAITKDLWPCSSPYPTEIG